MKRIKRQRAIEGGKPVDTSLQPMALNPSQKRELSDLHEQPRDDQKHGVAMRSRASVLGSLAIHAIAVFIAAFYVVRTAQVDDEAVSVDFFQEILKERPPTDRPPIVKPEPQPIRAPEPIVRPILETPVNPLTPESGDVLSNDETGGFVDPETLGDAGIDTDGINNLDGMNPIKPPTVHTGDPTESFRARFEDSNLGIIDEPPDPENTPDPDLTGANAFKPQKVTRLP